MAMKKILWLGIFLALLSAGETTTVPLTGSLAGSRWRLVAWSVGSLDPAGFKIIANFRSSTLSGRGPVNSYSCTYRTTPDGRFTVGELQTTLIGCESEDAMRAEAYYFALLRQARLYALSDADGTLRLMNGRNRAILVFQRRENARLEFTGTVRWKPFEGGFYAIDADDGRTFEPLQLPSQFRRDGLRVRVIAKERLDMVSFRMYGTIIEILSISHF
jgi:hypothetical protein